MKIRFIHVIGFFVALTIALLSTLLLRDRESYTYYWITNSSSGTCFCSSGRPATTSDWAVPPLTYVSFRVRDEGGVSCTAPTPYEACLIIPFPEEESAFARLKRRLEEILR